MWQHDLDNILELADKINLKHLSLYQLTIENNTAFEQQVAAKLWSPMNDDKQSELYMHTYASLHNAGWDFYEISNAGRTMDVKISPTAHACLEVTKQQVAEQFLEEPSHIHSKALTTDSSAIHYRTSPLHSDVSRETFESVGRLPEKSNDAHITNEIASKYTSKHNLIYWRYQEYLGIGPGAHSRMMHNNTRIKFNDAKSPYKWLGQIEQAESGFLQAKIDYEELDAQSQFHEKALMGLRLKEGILINEEEMQFIDTQKLAMLIEKGFLLHNGNNYSTTLPGRMCLNAVLKMMLK